MQREVFSVFLFQIMSELIVWHHSFS